MSTAITRSSLLAGCQPIPVLSYLKALGVVRLVSEQADPAAAGWWTPQGFRLDSALTLEDLHAFFLNRYAPTPIVAPWNGRSGFFTANYDRDSEKLVTRLAASDDPRLADLRSAIAVGRQLHEEGRARGWIAPDKDGKLKVVAKDACITYCRNRFPDAGVVWLDAVAALAAEGPAFSVLLGGSGGNLGSLDLTNNWYQHLAALLLDDKPPRAARLLADALRGTATEPASKASIGQLDPGRAGGVGRQRGEGSSAVWVNPWDFVLGLEGSLLFASAIARRNGRQGATGRSAMPFTVAGSAAGARGGADDESVRGEVWLPLWQQAVTVPELTRLFGEARVQWDGRQAANGIDFVSAVVTLGVDRGLDAYQRVAIAERLGQSSLAAPVGRVAVTERPEVRTTVELDRWLRRVESALRERKRPPASILLAVRSARSAQYRLADRGGGALLTEFLSAIADVEMAVARSSAIREKVTPVRGPDPGTVVDSVADGSPEAAVALALASLRDPIAPHAKDSVLVAHSLRACMSPVRLVGRRWQWLPDRPAPVTGLAVRPLAQVLADVLVFRSRKGPDATEPEADNALRGVVPWFRFGWSVTASTAELLAAGLLDTARIGRLLRGLLLLDWEYSRPELVAASAGVVTPVPAHRLLAAYFSPRPLHRGGQTWRLRPEPGWGTLLRANRTDDVVRQALRRLRVVGFTPLAGDVAVAATTAAGSARDVEPMAAGVRGPDLAAAALLHLRPQDYVAHLAVSTQVPRRPSSQESAA